MTPPAPARASRYRVRKFVLAALLGVCAWYIARSLGAQWTQVRASAATLRPRWSLVVAASGLVLATYGLLIQSWRSLVAGWGGRLAYWTAARIWAVSNLARYLPGTLWSVGAMGVLADDAGVPPATAAGAAIVNMLLNLAAGFVVLTVAGSEVVGRLVPRVPYPRATGAVLGLVGAALLPVCLPVLTATAARVLRRPPPVTLPRRAVAGAFGANVAAWCTYGVAFAWFAHALEPSAGDNWAGYIAVYAFSYLTGFLALLAPAGLFVREAAMVVALTRAGLASQADALVLAAASRLWLTILELVPGLAFVATGALHRRAVASSGRD